MRHTIRTGVTRHLRGVGAFGRSGAAAALLAGVLIVSGCASYANVPEPESPASVTSPNRRQPRAVMKASLVRVLEQFPPNSRRYAIGLPEGVSVETIDDVLGALGPGAELAGPRTRDLPTYAIGRIWIRSGKSKVDVFRPVTELGPRSDGTFERQAITVWLEGGLDPWRVTRTQRWEIGAFPRPDVASWPEDDAIRQEETQAAPEAPEAWPSLTSGGAVPPEAAAQGEVAEGEDFVETAPTPPAAKPEPARQTQSQISDDGVIRIEPVDD